ncbi:hypothetical protein ACQ4PT_055928 [Festuca glaucescens]
MEDQFADGNGVGCENYLDLAISVDMPDSVQPPEVSKTVQPDCSMEQTKADGEESKPWQRRPRRGVIPDESEPSIDRVSALENALSTFADRKTDVVIYPSIGTRFDSISEAYDFYNLYSWECGFGIRYGKSRLNVKKCKSMQELYCGCAGKAEWCNTKSARTECRAMIRLLDPNRRPWMVCSGTS